jgi:hypothetical protein
MATKKKVVKKKSNKRTVHRLKPAPWAKSKMAQGTVTVTISLEHVIASLAALGKNMRRPEILATLRHMLNQIEADKMAQKGKRKKKPARDPGLN